MNESDLTKLRELTLLLDLAYMHRFRGEQHNYKSAEASVRLEFGNFWYRQRNQTEPAGPPKIESVVVYSSVFCANRVQYFDTLDDALVTVQSWYDYAKEHSEEVG